MDRIFEYFRKKGRIKIAYLANLLWKATQKWRISGIYVVFQLFPELRCCKYVILWIGPYFPILLSKMLRKIDYVGHFVVKYPTKMTISASRQLRCSSLVRTKLRCSWIAPFMSYVVLESYLQLHFYAYAEVNEHVFYIFTCYVIAKLTVTILLFH